MPPVFAHGRLRLYLLKLLDEAPRHGYEVIRLLEERFHGLYAPSAGTVYPRLAKLEAEGLVTHATEGGRKVYSITEAGRAELAGRGGELADLEQEIRESVSELAAEIRDDVRGAAGKLRSEIRAAASRARSAPPSGASKEWRYESGHDWQEQVGRARDEAREAQDRALSEVARIARQVQDQVEHHVARGDWPTGLREGLTDLTTELSTRLGGLTRPPRPAPPTPPAPPSPPPPPAAAGPAKPHPSAPPPAPARTPEPDPARPGTAGPAKPRTPSPAPKPAAPAPPTWPADLAPTGDPARDLDRLLDRFRDSVRDAARDHGITESQLGEARRRLSATAEGLTALLGGGPPDSPRK
ncbi:PadR family transcriptional regulator [Streptomyces qinzhouensis]|uniref:PadR family transcriptional regulator n=1 Tax=Streptomyces qinzhouensis TaxID=2599401 RepID=A0A5B8IN70_9ACTN|nr:PadR family transcriptional regulator [Streptomyces qinzhouensis]QDY78979.1 PadR family transcriptional regulator [Streptomyces qinzhouensis]